jgi:acyl-CoA hydrolase
MIDEVLARVLEPGQSIVVGQALGAPRQLIAALPRHLDRLRGSRILLGMVQADFPELPGTVIESFFPTGPFASRQGLQQRNAHYLRLTLHELVCSLQDVSRPVDVALAQGSVARNGAHSLGVTVDFIHAAASRARHVVLETHPDTPWTGPGTTIPQSALVHAIPVETGPLEPTPGEPRAGEIIAENLLPWIPDGATLEFGIGQWFPPLIANLSATRKGLRINTGQLGPWLKQLIEAGALDEAVPAVGTGAAGTADFYRFLDCSPVARLEPALFTHDPARLRALPAFRAINSVFEVDLLGQANSEVTGSGGLGGIGGLPDFARGAVANPDGLSIVVLSATAKGRSRIVPRVTSEIPSLAVGEIDVVVTEFSSADLRGLRARDRAEALIAVAAPEHRASLSQMPSRLEELQG